MPHYAQNFARVERERTQRKSSIVAPQPPASACARETPESGREGESEREKCERDRKTHTYTRKRLTYTYRAAEIMNNRPPKDQRRLLVTCEEKTLGM